MVQALSLRRHYSVPGIDPLEAVEWELRDATIPDGNGGTRVLHGSVEAPSSWSRRATDLVAGKLSRRTGSPEEKISVRQLVDRVVETVTRRGLEGGYFETAGDAGVFRAELQHILLRQIACFESSGKARTAERIVLDVRHPDIESFLRGACHSVRVDDEFMQAVDADVTWTTRADGRPVQTYRARDLMRRIVDAAWLSGDSGLQYDTAINSWNTCPEAGRLRASHPCSELTFVAGSDCNLASIDLMRFLSPDGAFDVTAFRHVCEIIVTAQDISIDHRARSARKNAASSRQLRPLGLGYGNLGALLMTLGLPYDSDAGRHLAAALTALMSGAAYAQSARLATAKGPFEDFAPNRPAMLGVLRRHRDAMRRIDSAHAPPEILDAGRQAWEEAIRGGEQDGLRNSQISLLTATEPIPFMMACDAIGIDPMSSLVQRTRFGDSWVNTVHPAVRAALVRLGYDGETIRSLLDFVTEHGTIEGHPRLDKAHLPVFDCVVEPAGGTHSIHYLAHLEMLAAVQPFISGVVSKTISMPRDTTPEEIADAYFDAWRLGLKAVLIRREGHPEEAPPKAARAAASRRPAASRPRAPWPAPEGSESRAPRH